MNFPFGFRPICRGENVSLMGGAPLETHEIHLDLGWSGSETKDFCMTPNLTEKLTPCKSLAHQCFEIVLRGHGW